MERPPRNYYCNKCGYIGKESTHGGCNYFASDSAEQRYIDELTRQRDELLEVLKEVLCTHDYHADDGQVAAEKAYKLFERYEK